jgi:hypothetical protein
LLSRIDDIARINRRGDEIMINSTQRWIGLFAVAMAVAVGSVQAQDIAAPTDQKQRRLDAASSADTSAATLADTIRRGMAREAARQVRAATQAAAPAPAKKPMTWGKKVGVVAAIAGAAIGAWYLWALQQPD